MILSSKISLKTANTGKATSLAMFITDFRIALNFYVDWLWAECEIDSQKFNIPKYIASDIKPPNTNLSARALKCAATQACGMVKSRVKALSKKQFVIKKSQKSGKPMSKSIRRLHRKYDKLLIKLVKPKTHNALPELNSICCNWSENRTNSFDSVIVLTSLGKVYGKISIPVKRTSHFNALKSVGEQMTSFLISENSIYVRFKIDVEKKLTGETEGADQGIRTCVTLSDRQVTTPDKHGHDLNSICRRIARRKKGSKAFARAQSHRTNYVNHSIKRLNLAGIKQINLEKLRKLGKGKRVSRLLQSFPYKEIRTAMEKACQLNGVRLVEQSNAYRSQRCNSCGFVHKSNRRGELFECRKCGFTENADWNAAMNHKVLLCYLPTRLSYLPNRSTGFYWKPDGLTDVNGLEITVPIA